MNINFAFCFVATAFVLVGFTLSVTESACFTEESVITFHDEVNQVFKIIKAKCAEKNKANNDEANEKCAKNKIKAVHKKCNGDGTNLDKADKCFHKELEIIEITYEKYEKFVFVALADKSKKEEVKAALQPCKSKTGMKLFMCGMNKLRNGPCPEVADLVSRMKQKNNK